MEAIFYEPKFKDGKIVAFADVEIAEGITLKGFRVVNGTKGLFASVPQKPVSVDGQTRYLNQIVFAKKSAREQFLSNLLEAYREWEATRTKETAS